MIHFKLAEFTCKCGCGQTPMNHSTIEKLDKAREIAGIPFIITSGYRCEAHNRAVGGRSNSAHTRGWAADIKALTARERFIIMNAAIKAGFSRIGVANSFIHVDDDPTLVQQVVWNY